MKILTRDIKQRFYQSRQWKQLRDYKLFVNPYCECPDCTQYCLETIADEVHHIEDVDIAWHLRLTFSNLMSIAHKHHSSITMTQNNKAKKIEKQSVKYDDVTLRLLNIVNINKNE